MSRKRIAAKILRGLPDGFSINKGRIYRDSYQHILLGVLIDGTSSKETWRILSFMYPLFRKASFIHIEYCFSLDHPDTPNRYSFCGSDETIAADALRAISQAGLVETIFAGLSPAQFLQQQNVANPENARAFKAFDVACAAGLCGDVDRARRGLVAARDTTIDLATRYRPYRDHEIFLQAVENGLRSLDDGPDAFRAHMEREATVAAALHGFCSPNFGGTPPSPKPKRARVRVARHSG